MADHVCSLVDVSSMIYSVILLNFGKLTIAMENGPGLKMYWGYLIAMLCLPDTSWDGLYILPLTKLNSASRSACISRCGSGRGVLRIHARSSRGETGGNLMKAHKKPMVFRKILLMDKILHHQG